MNVAIAIHPFGRFGGGERLSILHALGLAERGLDVTFYTDILSFDPSWVRKLVGNVRVKSLPHSLIGHRFVEELGEFDRIIVHHHVDPLVAFRIAKAHGQRTLWYTGEVLRAVWESEVTGQDYRLLSPTIFSTTSQFYGWPGKLALSPGLYGVTSSAIRVLDRMTVYRYRAIIANSHYMAELTSKVYEYRRPISVVYPCSSLPPIAPRYGEGEYILAVGALTPNKNFSALVKAASLLKEKPCIIIAGDGPEKSFLSATAKKLGVPLEIHSGLSDGELASLYEKCSFVVVPSLSEPFGMTAVEAALAGKPSIVTDLGGTKEFAQHDICGIVVNPHDVERLAQALELLLENSDLRARLGKAARDRVLNQFTLDDSVDSLLKVVKQ